MAAVKTLVDDKVKGKKVMVFSKSTCPYCKMAKGVFKDLITDGTLSTDDYEVMEIGNNPDCGAIQDYLMKKTGARTVPRVFINGDCIGGGSEVDSMNRQGKLKALLKA